MTTIYYPLYIPRITVDYWVLAHTSMGIIAHTSMGIVAGTDTTEASVYVFTETVFVLQETAF